MCTKCKQEEEEGGPRQYIREYLRTVYIRRQQHLADYRYCARKHQIRRSHDEDPRSSFMWDHQVEAHRDDQDISPEADFEFTIVSHHMDPLSRQIAEAAKIRKALDTYTFQSSGS